MPMQAMEMRFFGGISLGIFAPRMGKKGSCKADDQYRKAAANTTLQGCFLECQEDSQCENVFVPFVDIVYMEKPPPMQCILLGATRDPSTACTEGTGTLINKLPVPTPGRGQTHHRRWVHLHLLWGRAHQCAHEHCEHMQLLTYVLHPYLFQ